MSETRSEPGTSTVDAAGGLALGWRMQELYLTKLSPQPGLPKADHSFARSLISWASLSPNQKALVLLHEIQMHLRTLSLEPADFRQVATEFDTASESDRVAFNTALQDLHVDLITITTARDPRMGKAYRLGFAMAETAFLPYRLGAAQFKEVLNRYRLDNIYGWLTDLKSVLPDHSSEAVQASLASWQSWYETMGEARVAEATRKDSINTALRLQAETWRAILTGEKKAVDLLTTSDYLRAAGDMAGHIASLTATVVRTSTARWIGFVLALLVVAFAAVGLATGGAAITATIAALGALGITAGGLSGAVQKALQPVQSSLWQSDLSSAVGIAATKLPKAPAAPTSSSPTTPSSAVIASPPASPPPATTPPPPPSAPPTAG